MVKKLLWRLSSWRNQGLDPVSGRRRLSAPAMRTIATRELIWSEYINGPDISKWQGYPVDFKKMKSMGAQFVFIRAGYSYNGNYPDPYWEYNSAHAVDAELYCGNYYYANPLNSNAVTQAEFFSDLIKFSPCQLPPVVDMETNGGLSAVQLADWTKLFLDTVERKTGKKPMIYTGAWFWTPNVAHRSYWKDYKLWAAHYFSSPTYEPTIPTDWDRYTFHQWTSSGVGSEWGVLSDGIDLNKYNGTMQDFIKEFNLEGPEMPAVILSPGMYSMRLDGNLVIAKKK